MKITESYLPADAPGSEPQRRPAEAASARAWIGFLAMCLGMFMAILDIQIVASSLAEIQRGLDLQLNQISWIQTAYLIAEIIAIPLTGWLTRALSTRGVFVGAILGFTAASAACALSQGFTQLIIARAVQGFCGGMVIPSVFATIFLMFSPREQTRATVLAGLFAMLAPTLGPVLGGYITATFTWHWLFLINVGPGLAVAAVTAVLIDLDRGDLRLLRQVDFIGLILLALALGSLEVWLKEAPGRGWSSTPILLLGAFCLICGSACVRRCLTRANPVADFRIFREPTFAIACWYSFVLGMALYGSVYLMPVFLALVRQHTALEIGTIMIVSGVAQLVAAPAAPFLEKRIDPRVLTAVGYGLFAVGLAVSGFDTFRTDFREMILPQILRGSAVLLCVLPTTSLALGNLSAAKVPDGSGLFNMMRNLGGAIGLALIDTVLELRTPGHIDRLVERLQAGDADTARFVGLPTARFHGVPIGAIDQATRDSIAPFVKRAGLVASFEDAWFLLAAVVVISLVLLPFMRRPRHLVPRAYGFEVD